MDRILKLITTFKTKQNAIELLAFVAVSLCVFFILIQLYNVFYLVYPTNYSTNYYIALILKIFWLSITVYVYIQIKKRLMDAFSTAQQIDKVCGLTDDEVTNAYEMITNTPAGNPVLIDAYLESVSERVEKLDPSHDIRPLKKSSFYLLLILLICLFTTDKGTYSSFLTFSRHSLPYHDTISIQPGNVAISKGESITISVVNPIEQANYALQYRYEDLWRMESFGSSSSYRFNNIDQSFYYVVSNQWSVSDTFLVSVIDDPNVLKLSLKYFYPDYINKRTDYIDSSDGFINIPQFTEVEMSILTPETIREAFLVFADKSFLAMQSSGRDSWTTTFTPTENTNYHFLLTDELGKTNPIVSRSISVIKDVPPLISFV